MKKQLQQLAMKNATTRSLIKSLSLKIILPVFLSLLSVNLYAQGTWSKVTTNAPNENMGVMILLTDGTVMCHNATGGTYGTGWDKLTPDIHGSYVNGTWTTLASMSSDRLFFPTQVLIDGRVFAAGGEYGAGATKGEVYNPTTNTWTATGAVTGGANIYDGNSEILASGTVLVGDQLGSNPSFNCLFYTPGTNTWSNAPSSPLNHDEAQWLKLPDSSILFVGINTTKSCRYIPKTNTWVNDANLPVSLYDPFGEEAGAAFMLPDGRAIFLGATGHNAYYTPSGTTSPGTWAAAPDFPKLGGIQLGTPDASAAMMSNGKILCAVSFIGISASDEFRTPTYFFEFDYTTNTFTQVTSNFPGLGTDSLAGVACYQTTMLDLPDGTVLMGVNQAGAFSKEYFIYNPTGSPLASGKPTIRGIDQSSCPTYKIYGTGFNGICEGAAYGDDWQMSTNYPIIRLTSGTNVYYAKTSNWNRIGAVMTDSLADTATFTLPAGLPNGTYSLVVIANGNPSSPTTISTPCSPCVPITMTVTNTGVKCNGGSTGIATATPTNGTAPYTYAWAPGGNTNQTATGLSAGTYTVTVTDKNGCSGTASTTITQPTALTVSTGSIVNVKCNGSSTGSATATAGGGTVAYTYAWTPGGGTSATASNLSAGTYTVTVTDANACTATASAVITQPTALTVTTTTTAATCGSNNGTAKATPAGGTGTYTYSWAPGGQTSQTATGLSAGTYTVTVTDANACTATASATVTSSGGPTVSISSSTNVSCRGGSNGSINTTTSGGTSPYTYSWAPTGQTTANVTGLSAATYTVTVTDKNGCISTASVTITQPASALTVSTSGIVNVKCNGAGTGSATATAAGGTSPYAYAWAPGGQTNATATGLSAGTYTVTATDKNGCTATASATITQPATALSVTTTTTSATCGSSNGSAKATPAGGTGAYTYAWAPGGQTNQTATNLSAGTYTVTVTDANGCTATASATVTSLGGPTITISSTTNVSCNGGSNGSINTTTTGGTAPYTYNWAPTGQTTANITGLSAATYTITLKDANGCISTASATITQPVTLTVTTTTIGVKCNGGSTGSATATPAGGTSPYTYAWAPGGQTNATATNLSAATYTVTVTDKNGCTKTASATVTQPAVLTVTATNTSVKCNGGSTGTATATPAGGTSPYTYTWTPGGQTSATATGLSAGTYTITLKDANGCSATASTTITQPTALTATISGSTNVSCNGGSDGTATVTAGGGTPAYTYLWTPIGNNNATATGLSAGTYTVTVTDANSCTKTASVIITQPPPMTVTPSAPVICSGSNVVLTASGATTYSWSPATGLSATTGATVTASPTVTTMYTVTGTTGTCITTATVVVTVNPSPVITLTPPSANLCSGDSLTITASGANNYTWAPGTGLSNTTGLIVTAFPGVTTTYTVTGTTGSCSTTKTVTITVTPTPTVTVSPSSPSPICSGGSVNLTASGATTYSWSPATGLSATTGANVTASPTVTTSYTVIGTNGSCSNMATVVVTVNPTPKVSVMVSKDSICSGGPGASLTASGATTYSWSPAAGLSATTGANVTATPTITTTYTVVGTTGSCSDSQMVTITVSPTPTVTVSPSSSTVCSGNSVTLIASGATTYTWSPATGLSVTTGDTVIATPTVTTSYTVTGSNGGCTSTTTVLITVNPSPNVTVSPTSATICASGPGTNLTASGAGSYTWKPATGLSATTGAVVTATPTVTTTYTVIGTNPILCKDSAMVTITVDSAVMPAITGKDTICKGDSTTLTASGGGTYTWSNGATTASITIMPTSTTTYTVTVKKGLCSATTTNKVVVNVPVTPTVTQSGDTLKCIPTGMTYQWYKNGNPLPGSTFDTLIISGIGSYKVAVTNTSGCSDTGKMTVTTTLGINEISLSEYINVYPNPTTGNVQIECNNIPSGEYKLTLTDVLGQVLYTDQLYISGRYTSYMNLSNYDSGLYILTIKGENSVTEKKILLNR